MRSAFGVDHGQIYKAQTRQNSEDAKHYGRMAGATGTVGGTAGALSAGSGVVGHLERKGKDPMGFTYNDKLLIPGRKDLSAAGKAKILGANAAAHRFQSRALAIPAAGGLALAGGYKAKQRRAQGKPKLFGKAMTQERKRKASDAALGAGAVGLGGGAAYGAGWHGKTLGRAATNAIPLVRWHHAGAEAYMNQIPAGGDVNRGKRVPHKQYQQHVTARKLHARVLGVKGAGAVGSGVMGAAGLAGAAELARHHGKKKLRKP